jgi:hypothetical protein
LVLLPFNPDSYGPEVAHILSLDGGSNHSGGDRPMELFPRACASEAVREMLVKGDVRALFPGARDADAALSGLFLYFSCLKEAHDLVHAFDSGNGAYWHGIMHRMEGDAYNAGYWFRRLGHHPVFPALAREAAQSGYGEAYVKNHAENAWDPFAFIRFCETAPGSNHEDLARRVQLAEWQLLFDYCASPANSVADHTRLTSGMASR